jgi:hypothetical protein
MAELHHILGSLFSDIAQSVFTSDLYSRDISRYYEQDALLRHFPVPRTEIAELEVELKFAIAGLELNPAQTIGREANAATIFIDLAYELSENFHDKLSDALSDLMEKRKDIDPAVLERTAWPVNLLYLRQDLLQYFQHNQSILIQDGKFNVSEARAEIQELLKDAFTRLMGKEADKLTAKDKKDVLERVNKAIKLDSNLKSLEEPLQYAWNRAGDFKLDVEITAEKLGELSSEHLSSVHVRTRVRNYKWSEVEHEGRQWWALNPE